MGPDGLPQPVDSVQAQDHFEDFYEDVWLEMSKFGKIEALNVCDNLADHMVGNVYVKFGDEESAAKALANLQGRYYAGRPIMVEFSPVTDFREATCRQYEENTCNRGGYCNFMHLKQVQSRELRRALFGRNMKQPNGRVSNSPPPRRRNRSRSRSPRRDRYGGGGGGGGVGGGGGGGGDGRDNRGRRRRSPRRDKRGEDRETSQERRDRIATWNKERQQTQDG